MKSNTSEAAGLDAQDSSSAEASSHAAQTFDVQIGQKIKTLRRERALSQSALGRSIGVSFQQIQKYEKGANALSVSKLCAIARALEVDALSFIPDPAPARRSALDAMVAARAAFAASPDGMRLLDAFRALPSHSRRMTLAAVTALAESVCVAYGGARRED